MKLLQINTTLNAGSTGRISEQIGNLAINNGWESYIIHGPRYINKSNLKCIKTINSIQEKIHIVKSMLFDAHGLSSVNATKNIINKIKTINPDIIHLHNIHGYFINYKILFEYLQHIKTPIVWTLHDCWSMTGHCAHFDSIGCDKWKKECFECPLINKYPKSLFIDRSKQNYRRKKELFTSVSNLTIVPVSKWLSSIVNESFLNKYPIHVINNGIDTNIFTPQETNLKNKLAISNETILLGVSNAWSNNKGLKEFIELSKDSQYKVILVGISKELRKTLPSSIICIEKTHNQQELAEYYSLADILINPTYNDTFPTINMESMSCGTPVISYNTGGSPESITSKTGIIVERGNLEKLKIAIEEIKIKGKSFYSNECRKHAVDNFNQYNRFNDYMNLYNELIK